MNEKVGPKKFNVHITFLNGEFIDLNAIDAEQAAPYLRQNWSSYSHFTFNNSDDGSMLTFTTAHIVTLKVTPLA